MTQELWRLSAVEAARAVGSRQISARELTQSVLDRIDAVNPRINALVEVQHAQALREADEADRLVASGQPLGLLHGVPVTTKVNVDQRGCHSSGGLVSMRDTPVLEDSAVVAALRRAGAVFVGRSNTPAFSMRWFTDNDAHGRTLNPWDASVTAGGSSGGAGAALAAGMGSIAQGNDLGGSIRYPAYACGVAGLRPTPGRVPSYNPSVAVERSINAQLMTSQGPLARHVADLGLAFRAMAVADVRDPLWTPAAMEFAHGRAPCKVALVPAEHFASIGWPLAPGVESALRQAALWLEAAGYEVEAVNPPQLDACSDLWRQLVCDELRRAQPMVEALGDAASKTYTRFMLDWTPALTPDAVAGLLGRRLGLARAWSQFFDRYPLLLLPTSCQLTPAPDEDLQSLPRLQALTQAQGPLLATAMLGLPGLAVPTGLVNGKPMGVQLCASGWREDRLLAAGEVIEAAAKTLKFAPI